MAESDEVNYAEEDCSEDDDDDSVGWSEMNVECESTLTCLFCPAQFKTMAVALEHCKAEHNVDFMSLKRRFVMDCYLYISLINYIRHEGASCERIANATTQFWDNPKYLKPAIPDDPWLMFDFDSLESPLNSIPVSPTTSSLLKNENGMITMDEESYNRMQATIHQLHAELGQQSGALALAAEDIETMRKATQNLVSRIDNEESLDDRVGRMRITEDHGYFSSYSHFGIHHTMLSDKPRTISYRDAILKNAASIAGKVVLDVGCGTGILSMFCAQAGANLVIGVDQSDIIYNAMDIVRENGFEDKVTFIKGRVEEVTLPVDKVDVIVSEWMGYFLLYEGMLDAVILARDKFLRTGGLMLPNKCSISLFGISDLENYQENIGFWSDVYGYKMSSLRKDVLKEAFISEVPIQSVVTSPVVVHNIDLNSCSIQDITSATSFSTSFNLISEKDCSITAIGGYFDTIFDLPNSILLTTSPLSERTHWRQTIFFLSQPLTVKSGEVIPGHITCNRNSTDLRTVEIILKIGESTNNYFFT